MKLYHVLAAVGLLASAYVYSAVSYEKIIQDAFKNHDTLNSFMRSNKHDLHKNPNLKLSLAHVQQALKTAGLDGNPDFSATQVANNLKHLQNSKNKDRCEKAQQWYTHADSGALYWSDHGNTLKENGLEILAAFYKQQSVHIPSCSLRG